MTPSGVGFASRKCSFWNSSLRDKSYLERGTTVRANLSTIEKVEPPLALEEVKISASDRLSKESVLVKRAQEGDDAAFSSLLMPYIRLSYRVALRITGNPEDAEDASQQSLLEAYTHIHQFHGESQFSTWLTRIVINEALMKLRKRRSAEAWLSHQTNPEDPNPVERVAAGDNAHPELLYLKWENERIVRQSIANLPSGSQAVVWLRGMQELKISETARILELSESAVKSRFTRARRRLRKILADQL